MKRFCVVLMLLVALIMPSKTSAQLLNAGGGITSGFSDFVTNSFINYYTEGGVQEKLYVITDKPFYSAGDTIYFSAFLVNSIYFNRTTDTKFIYVELIDAVGSVVSRLKVMGNEGRFHNAMSLSPRLTAGKYTLRAYTKWQTNFDKSLLFSRQLEIGNYIDDAIRTNVRYSFDGSGRVLATVEVTNSLYAPIRNNAVEFSLSVDGRNTRHMTNTNSDGIFRFSFRPSKNHADCISLYINANGRKLSRRLQLPSFEDDFSAKFLPEGGNLIAGIDQVVAFKAVGVDGRSVDVEGAVMTKSGYKVCDIRSAHKGMGKFRFKAYPNEVYIATLSTKNGITRSFTLPAAQPSGCVINLQPDVASNATSLNPISSNRLLLRVHTTPDFPRQQLSVVIQSRGIVNYVVDDVSNALSIPLDKLRSGVAQVSVVDKMSNKVVAQRLFFVRGKVANATITSNVKRFSPREWVNLDFAIKNSEGNAVKGDFVVSVTDADLLKEDRNADNILSYMLLNSDLKGHIENPTYYFEADDAIRNEHLDLVMLTHGWRRYNIDAILAGLKPRVKYGFEKEQCITGGVRSTVGKARNTSVMIFRNRTEYLGVFPLNSTNRFYITGVDSPDTAVYILRALNQNGTSERVRIKVDPHVYPTTPIIAREVYYKPKTNSLTEEYMVRSKHTYYEDGGMPVIDIDAVEIVAKRIQATYDYSSTLNDFNTVSGDMSRFSSIFDALQRFRQLEVIGNEVFVASSKLSASPVKETTSDEEDIPDTVDINMDDKADLMPAVYVNGQLMDMGVIDAYPMSEVISVSYLDKFESMAAGMGSETGAIILHVKDINARQKLLEESKAVVVVPGYASPVEFYAPDYLLQNDRSKRDNRTTIAWIPSLRSNSMGDASMSFWTADRQSDYRVIIEGITDEGELLHNELILQSK